MEPEMISYSINSVSYNVTLWINDVQMMLVREQQNRESTKIEIINVRTRE